MLMVGRIESRMSATRSLTGTVGVDIVVADLLKLVVMVLVVELLVVKELLGLILA